MKRGNVKRTCIKAGALILALAFLFILPFEGGAAEPQVAAGAYHTVGLQSNGTVVAVGLNDEGQTNVSSWTDIVAVAAGYSHTVGLKSDGAVVATGRNVEGQTNVSSWTDIVAIATGESHTVGLKKNGTVVAVGLNANNQTVVDSMTNIIAIGAGAYHTIGLRSNNTVMAVGNNSYQQTEFDDSWSGIVAVAGGVYQTIGLKSDGTVLAKGNNTHNQLNVGSWTDIVAVASFYINTVGLKSDGTVVAVGNNSYNQLDVGSWTDIVAVASGHYHTVGLKSDGTVVAVGDNTYGQLDVASFFLEPETDLKGAKGTILTLKGTGFGLKRGSVTVGGNLGKVVTWFDSAIIVQVKNALFPGMAYPVEIITGTKGAAPIEYGKSFFMKAPKLDTIQPNQGPVGSTVVLSGKYFGSKKGTVQLGSIFCPVKYWYMDTTNGKSMAVFTIPKTLTPGHYPVTLFAEAGSIAFRAAAFTVKAPTGAHAATDPGSQHAEDLWGDED